MNRKRIIIISTITLLLIGMVAVWYFFIRARHTGVINAMPDDVVLFFDIQNNKAFDEFIRYDAAMQTAKEIPLLANYSTITDYTPLYYQPALIIEPIYLKIAAWQVPLVQERAVSTIYFYLMWMRQSPGKRRRICPN